MTDTRSLNKEIESAKLLAANMADIIGDDMDLLSDMIEGETGLFEIIDRAIKRVGELEAIAASIDEYSGKLASRKSRLKKQSDTLRSAVITAMSVAGKDSMELPSATISVKATPRKLVIIDEALIPAEYWKPSDPKLDRKALLAAVKDDKVPGAERDNGGETLSIRRA